MNKKFIKLLCPLMILILSASLVTFPVTAEENIKVVLNGEEIAFDVPPQLIDDRTMVPMRAIFEALGADVYWDVIGIEYFSVQMITAAKNEIKILMAIDEPGMYKFVGYGVDEFAAFLDESEDIELDVPPQLVDGRTLVPVRAISEAFGIDVDWDDDTSTVILSCDEEFIANVNTDKDFHGEWIDFFNRMLTGDFEDIQTEVTVSTPDEFIAALGSNTKILLQPGVYNLSTVKQEQSSNYQVFWAEQFDGNELCLSGIQNLTIEGIGDKPSEIIIEPRYAYVLNFMDSSGITITNIKAGHTDAGSCEGGVFSFTDCSDIFIDNTHMYGCGTVGLNLENVIDMTVIDSSIYECTYYIMTVEDCEDIYFENCVFRDNQEFDLVNIYNTSNLSINNSEFRNNNTNASSYGQYAMFSVLSSDNISVTNTNFVGNSAWVLCDTDNIDFENNTLENNSFINASHPRYSYPNADDVGNDELWAYSVSLYMTTDEVVSLVGKPKSKRTGQFKNHYPFDVQQEIYNYENYSVIFDQGKVIAISINDTKYITSRGVKLGDDSDTVMNKYGYTRLNDFWNSLYYSVPYEEGSYITSCIDFIFNDENKVAEIMIRQIGY